MTVNKILLALITIWPIISFAQHNDNKPTKITHAEPLYIDLIRDLGAHKGEKEWNVGVGMYDRKNHDTYEALIEYEWAPIDRLGLEIELPFTIASGKSIADHETTSSQLNSVKLAAQYTFLVNEDKATSMAIGYINEFELSDFKNFGKPLFKGNIYNPFFVAAKRWGNNVHTLLYTGPKFEHSFSNNHVETHWEINSNFHYMIPQTRNFIGLEINKNIHKKEFEMIARPQMRLAINDNTMLGIVVGIPIKKMDERMSTFLRLIWEPPHKTK